MRKILSIVLSFGLLFQQSGLVYAVGELNLANYLSQAKSAIVQPDQFRPPQLRYISYDIKSNDFKLLLDKGDIVGNGLKPFPTQQEEAKLFNYFLIGLSLPNDTFWVNLRPDAPENIIDPLLEKTDIGKIFLDADLQLKKDTAGLTSPQNPEGKAYWDKLYKKAGELFGTENITIPTITRPWIVPNEVIVRETEDSAYIYKATLKVMLEEDYLKSSRPSAFSNQQYNFNDPRLKELNQYSTQLIRETILPKLTQEVNSSQRYAKLRQVYYSLVLSRWFKQKYSSLGSTSAPERPSTTLGASQSRSPSVNSYIGLIDSGNLANLTSQEPCDKQAYFQDYQKSFKDGEYNLKETVATPFGQSIRSYISGGIVASPIIFGGTKKEGDNLAVTKTLTGQPTASPLTVMEAREIIKELNMLNDFHPMDSSTEKKLNSLIDNKQKLLSYTVKLYRRKLYDDDEARIYFRSSYLMALGQWSLKFLGIIVQDEEHKMKMNGSKLREYFEGKDDMSNKVRDFIMAMDEFNRKYIASAIREGIEAFFSGKNLSTEISDIYVKFEKGVFVTVEITSKTTPVGRDIRNDLMGAVFFTGNGFKIRGIPSAKYSDEDPKVLVMTLSLSNRIPKLLDFYQFKIKVINIYKTLYNESVILSTNKIRVLGVLSGINDKIAKYQKIDSLGRYLISGAVPELLKECENLLNETEAEPEPEPKLKLMEMFKEAIEKTKTLCEENDVSSSPITNTNEGASSEISRSDFKKGLGGVDLTDRMLNIKLERVGSFALSALALPEITNVKALDLDDEYERIQAMASVSIRPSDTRILEFAAACYYRGEFDQRLAQVSSCIKAAHLADEISGRDSSEALRLATMLPDALYGG